MEEARQVGASWPFRAYLGLVVFSLAGSALSRATGLDPGLIAPVAGALTLLAGLAAVFAGAAQAWGPGRTVLVLGAVGLLGAGSEIAGLYTGAVFGRYEYTSVWAPVVLLPGGKPFPLLLPFAWMMMAGAAWLACARVLPGRMWAAVLAGGLLAALADIPMEPVMVHTLGYWKWLEPGPLPGGAPIMNFVGWTVTSWAAGGVLAAAGAKDDRKLPEPALVLAVHTVFTVLLGLIGRPSLG